MSTTPLSELLKLPATARAGLAMALWDSLAPAEREAALALTPSQEAELDRRSGENTCATPNPLFPGKTCCDSCEARPCRSACSSDRRRKLKHSRRAHGTRQREASLGEAFTAELAKAVSAIREHPLQFTRVRGETRRVILNRFPYAVYFRVTEAEVIMLAVYGRRIPNSGAPANDRRWARAFERFDRVTPSCGIICDRAV